MKAQFKILFGFALVSGFTATDAMAVCNCYMSSGSRGAIRCYNILNNGSHSAEFAGTTATYSACQRSQQPATASTAEPEVTGLTGNETTAKIPSGSGGSKKKTGSKTKTSTSNTASAPSTSSGFSNYSTPDDLDDSESTQPDATTTVQQSAPLEAADPNVAFNKSMAKSSEAAAKTAESRSITPAAKKSTLSTSGADIEQVNEGGKYCGKYGGFNCNTTDTANMAVDAGSKFLESAATSTTQRTGQSVTSNLASKGSSATISDSYRAQAEVLKNAGDTKLTMGAAETTMAIGQGVLAYMHHKSISKVDTAREEALQELASDTSPAALDLQKTVNANHAAEVDAQKNKALTQAITASVTAMKGIALLKEGAIAKEQAKTYEGFADTANSGSNFAFNPSSAVQQNPNTALNMPTPDASAVTASTDDTTNADGGAPIDPNAGGNGVTAPAPGVFTPSDPKLAGGGGGGSPGGVSGTSAAKDDAAKGDAPSGATQKGSYSAGDGGSGSKFSRAAGAPSVGDSSFADMMKKFLPGGEEEKKPEGQNMAYEDRSPASDKAAVMGRNQNIFDEIHKRYQKKNNEGAIVFGGQT